MTKKSSVGIVSLGCSKNLVDSEIILGSLQKEGYAISRDVHHADVVIVNTCTFIKDATAESIDAILEVIELKRAKKVQAIVVTGCLPQRYWKDNLSDELKEVDAFLGLGQYQRIGKIIDNVVRGRKSQAIDSRPGSVYEAPSPRYTLTPSHYAYVKISEGCDNRCSYCVIPQVRGPHRSRRMKSIVKEIERLSQERPLAEINFVGQDTTLYGTDIYGRPRLATLLRRLARSGRVKWIRLLYTHPAHFGQEVIDVIGAEPSICNYVDLPLQHINDTMLKRMGRRVSRKKIEKLIERLRSQISDLTLRTTFIVGFPGETEHQFQELLDFVQNFRFERLGAFTYSREERTSAYTFTGQIPDKVKKERLAELMKSQRTIALERNRSLIGRELEVLVDSRSVEDSSLCLARTEGDAPEVDQLVYVRYRNLKPGQFVRVRITDAYEYDLVGEPT